MISGSRQSFTFIPAPPTVVALSLLKTSERRRASSKNLLIGQLPPRAFLKKRELITPYKGARKDSPLRCDNAAEKARLVRDDDADAVDADDGRDSWMCRRGRDHSSAKSKKVFVSAHAKASAKAQQGKKSEKGRRGSLAGAHCAVRADGRAEGVLPPPVSSLRSPQI